MSILIGIFSFVLLITAIVMILLILMQKSQGGGLGSAMGGGMAESAFGAETDSILVKLTRNATITFFVLSFGLYLGHLYLNGQAGPGNETMPSLAAPEMVPVEEVDETALDISEGIIDVEDSISFNTTTVEETAAAVEETAEEVAP
ncbi:MAG: preprotein translocase subunit SecG [Opitutaceae bacterium]|nr:preprotein translocase subunit SecG [Opitutaceae bacterium]